MNKVKTPSFAPPNRRASEGKQNAKRFFLGFSIFFLIFFIFLNIFASQKISPIYFQLINNNRKATVNFLKRIKTHPQFAFFLKTNKNIFNHYLENEVFSEQRKNEEKIAELESLLAKNPKSRDIIYKLYLINKDLGNDHQAEKYLKMAKEIDPNIK